MHDTFTTAERARTVDPEALHEHHRCGIESVASEASTGSGQSSRNINTPRRHHRRRAHFPTPSTKRGMEDDAWRTLFAIIMVWQCLHIDSHRLNGFAHETHRHLHRQRWQ